MTLGFYRDYQELFRGCIAYLDLSSRGISGTTIYNPFGTINATKNASSALTTTDRFGFPNNALKFNGTADGGIDTGIYTPSAFTVVVWVYPNAVSSSSNRKVCGDNNNNNMHRRGWDFCIEPINSTTPNTGIVYGDGASTQQIIRNSSTFLPVSGIWTMYTVLFSGNAIGSRVIVYKNLDTVINTTTVAKTRTINHNNLRIGSQGDSYGSRQSVHAFGEVMVFDRVLSAVEVKTLYDLTSKKYLYPVIAGYRGLS